MGEFHSMGMCVNYLFELLIVYCYNAIKEAVAKLLCPEKSKILRPFASGSISCYVPFDEANLL